MIRLLAIADTGQVSGAEAVLLRTVRAAMEQGWEVTVAAPAGALSAALAETGAAYTEVPELRLGAGPRVAAATRLALAAAVAGRRLGVAARQADVVLVNGVSALPAVRAARLRIPVVWLVHDVLQRPDRLAMVRTMSPAVDLGIAVSEAAAAPVRAAGIETIVIANGTTWPTVAAPQPPPRPAVIGCAAALTSWKGQDVLLEAATMLPEDVTIELAGGSFPKDGPFVAQLHELAESPALRGRVRFLGRVDDVMDTMRRWTVCVSPSVDPEAGPLHVLEAMSVGVPLVGTDHGGTPEVLGDAGLLVPPRDAKALADAIHRLLSDDELRRRCVEAGPRIVAANYQLSDRIAELLDAVSEAASNPHRGSSHSPLNVIAVPDYAPHLGGTTRLTENQALALHGAGRPVVVVTRRTQGHWPRQETIRGIPVVRLGTPGDGPVAAKAAVVALAVWLRRRRSRIGAVHAVMYPDFAVAASAVGLARRSAMTWAGLGDATETIGLEDARRAALQRLRRRLLTRVTQVALTPRLAQELTSVGLGADTRVIPIPIDLKHFRPPDHVERAEARSRIGAHDDDVVIVYTGHLRTLKAVDRLIDAAEELLAAGHPIRLVVVGGGRPADDDEEPSLRRRGAEVGDKVMFTGPVSDVVPSLWAADIFVLPSTREGFPNSLLEAMACGLACVAPPSAGGDEVLGETAGVVPPSSQPADLVDALEPLVIDPDRRRRLGQAAHDEAQRYGFAAFAPQYLALVDEIGRKR